VLKCKSKQRLERHEAGQAWVAVRGGHCWSYLIVRARGSHDRFLRKDLDRSDLYFRNILLATMGMIIWKEMG
jgi:hypothetical protein